MTDMKRITISLDDDIDRDIYELRKDDEFVRCSYSEIVRRLLRAGFEHLADRNREPEKEVS